MRSITFIAAIVLIITSCGTSKKATESAQIPEEKTPTVQAPEGIEFKTIENYSDFALINLPVSGKGFKENTDYTGAEFPVLEYSSQQLIVRANLNDFEGPLEEQFEKLKRTLYFKVKPEEEVTFEKSVIGEYETALIKIYRKSASGYQYLKYGYLISHNNKAATFFIKEGYFLPESDVDAYIATLDETMQYMIKTCKFN